MLFYTPKTLFNNSYLISLKLQTYKLFQSEWTNLIGVGDNYIRLADIILINLSDRFRLFWQLKKVLEDIVFFYNEIRNVKLMQEVRRTYHRSFCHLILKQYLTQNAAPIEPLLNEESMDAAEDPPAIKQRVTY